MATAKTYVGELYPSDFHRRPVTEKEFATWRAMTPEQRAIFGNMVTPTFRWVLHVQGSCFPDWLEVAVGMGGIWPR